MSLSGGCACGAVRFAAEGEPVQTTFCHCGHCRRAAGAPFVLWVGYPAAAVQLKGPLVERATTSTVSRGACATCGGALSYRDAAIEGDEIYLAAGAFDRPEALAPTAHAYWPQRLPFIVLADDLPRFRTTTRQRRNGPAPERI